MKRLVLLSVAYLMFFGILILYAPSEASISGSQKISVNFGAITDEVSPNDMLLIWLDVYISPTPDGRICLSGKDLSPVTDLGAKIAGVTFSPDGQLVWYLVETRVEVVPALASLPMVQNSFLAKVGVWDAPAIWWNTTKIDPLLSMIAERLVDADLHVVINYAEENENKSDIVSEITTLVESVGGRSVRIGLAEYILAEVPANTLDQIVENNCITTLEAVKPIYPCEETSTKFLSHNQGSPILLLSLAFIVCYFHMKKSRKIKSSLLILLMATSPLLLFNIPFVSALNVSRLAIGADRAGNEGDDVVVAVVDFGVDSNHQYLEDAILANIDITGNNNSMDYRGHGTHVAGIVASRSARYRGVAPRSKIINVKLGEAEETLRDAIQWCIYYKNEYNISIIQISVSTLERTCNGKCPTCEKADEAVASGLVVVAGVCDQDTNGNGKYELGCPSQAFNVISVGAINDLDTTHIHDDTMAFYSSYGLTEDGREKPEVVAPGDRTDNPLNGIWSTRSSNASAENYEAVDGVYGRMSGTSMATPHVSGTAALILNSHPDWTPHMVKYAIKATARLNDNLQESEGRGKGIVDASRAVSLRSVSIPVDEAEETHTEGDGEYTAHAYLTGSYRLSAGLEHPDHILYSYALGTLNKTFSLDYNVTNPKFFFRFHYKGFIDPWLEWAELHAILKLFAPDGSPLFQIDQLILKEDKGPPCWLDNYDEINHTHLGTLLAGQNYTIEYGFKVCTNEAYADFASADRKVEALWLLCIGPLIGVGNPSFEERHILDPGVYGVPYWYANNSGWREFIGDICHTEIAEDGDGDVDQFDYWEFCAAFTRYWTSPIGFKTEDDYKADFDGDGDIDQYDSWTFYDSFIRYYQIGPKNLDGAYSWYTSGNGGYDMDQWLCDHDVSALRGQQVTFSFWFQPNGIGNNATAKIHYVTETGQQTISGNPVYATEGWHEAYVTTTLPVNTVAIKVIIHFTDDFQTWIDKTSIDTS